MNDIEAALREELRSEHYQLVTTTPMADTVRRRIHRRRQLRYTAAAGATVLVVAVVVGLVTRPDQGEQAAVPPPVIAGDPASGSPPAGDPAGPGSTAPPASSPPATAGRLPVKGVPAYLAPADPAAAMGGASGLSVRPTGGQQAAFTRGDRTGPVDRVVVALDYTEPLGLPGTTVTLDWGASDGMRQLQTLATEDTATQTTYMTAWSPTGRRWFIAVTGPDADARRTVLQDVARQTMAGT
jgi:hypothetical protein